MCASIIAAERIVAVGVGDALAGDVRRRSVDGLEVRPAVAVAARRRNPQPACQLRGQVREDIAVEVLR
jgi:hypothetical protein